MERISRKIIKRIKELIFLIFFLINLICFAQEINIFEEIEAKSLKEIKTKIFDIFPGTFEEITLPKIPEIKFEEKVLIEKEKEREKIEVIETKYFEKERNIFLKLNFGSFSTKEINLGFNEKFLNLNLTLFHTENYRKNSEILNYKFESSFKKKNENLDINLLFGEIGLPGPTINPLNLKRNFISINWKYNAKFENHGIFFSHDYYSIEENLINFFNLIFEKNLSNVKFLLDFEGQTSEKTDFIFAFSPSIVFSKDKLNFKGSFKLYDEFGIKFLPEFSYYLNNNFSIFLNSKYRNPVLWKDLITDNWKGIKEEKFPPELKYEGGINLNFQNLSIKLSHSLNDIYLWKYNNFSFLYEPEKVNFKKTSFSLNSKLPILKNLNLFFDFEKNFFYEEINFLPKEEFIFGFDYKDKNLSFKFYNSYTGKRKFDEKEIDDFNLLNFEISYRKNIEFGLGIYNISNKNYEIVPYYPGEKRKILFWLKF